MNTCLNSDISKITGIPKLSLDKLSDRACFCIAHAVLESQIEGNNLSDIDIGIGRLYIKLIDNELKYKFIPSNHLDELISVSIKSKSSPVVSELDKLLKERIENTYGKLL